MRVRRYYNGRLREESRSLSIYLRTAILPMNRTTGCALTTFTTALLLVPLTALHAVEPQKPAAKPNILVILSDDQGYADAGFQGCKDIPTPQLDRLARSGLRCTSGYVSHPYCSPSRAGLLTGRCQMRFGHERNPHFDPDDRRQGLPLSETLLPQYFCVPAM